MNLFHRKKHKAAKKHSKSPKKHAAHKRAAKRHAKKHHAKHPAKHHRSGKSRHATHRHPVASSRESITVRIKEPKTEVESKMLNLEKTTEKKIEQMSSSFETMKSMLNDLKKENEQLLRDKKFLLQKTKDIILELHKQKTLHEKEKEAITKFARRSDAITQFYTAKEEEPTQNDAKQNDAQSASSGIASGGLKQGGTYKAQNPQNQQNSPEEKQEIVYEEPSSKPVENPTAMEKEMPLKKDIKEEAKDEKHHRFGFFHRGKGEKESKKEKKTDKKEKKEKKLSKKQMKELKNQKKAPKNVEEYEQEISESEEGKSKVPVSQIAFAEKGTAQRVETPLDELLELIMKRGSVSTALAAKEFKVKENQIEEWARVLEEHDLIEIHYPAFGKPLLKRKNV